MPRDKTESHIKVNIAIREEFMEKGFEGASIRSIGARAGMTSAGLYRHYPDKEAMFSAIVDPLIEEIGFLDGMKMIAAGRCTVRQGDVSSLELPEKWSP